MDITEIIRRPGDSLGCANYPVLTTVGRNNRYAWQCNSEDGITFIKNSSIVNADYPYFRHGRGSGQTSYPPSLIAIIKAVHEGLPGITAVL